MLPGPRHDGSEIISSLVRSASWIGTAIRGSFVMYQIQEVANVRSIDLVDIDAIAPGNPFGDG
ncbi:hypothetical protein [Planctomycetes bacterium CA13]|uniref:hypothetical protein n=1 Tax=Novipirellula herctigrandis TaxID=2527986 RepID=UPI0011B81F0B